MTPPLTTRVEGATEVLSAVFNHLDKGDGNAPGHGHRTTGVWDNDISNGDKAGQPCDWCATWASFAAILQQKEPLK